MSKAGVAGKAARRGDLAAGKGQRGGERPALRGYVNLKPSDSEKERFNEWYDDDSGRKAALFELWIRVGRSQSLVTANRVCLLVQFPLGKQGIQVRVSSSIRVVQIFFELCLRLCGRLKSFMTTAWRAI